MNYKKCIFHYILLFLIVITSSLFVTCASNRTKELQQQQKYIQYNTLELFFGFTYPARWYVFETGNGVQISNKVEILTSPPEIREQQGLPPHVFDGTVYFTDVEELKKVYDEYQNTLVSITTTFVGKKTRLQKAAKAQIVISHIDNLGIFAESSNIQEKERLQMLYKDAFFQDMPAFVRGAYFSDVLLLVAPQVIEYKKQVMLGLQLTAIHKTEDGFSSGYVGLYNTGIILPFKNIQKNVWQTEELTNNNVVLEFLQEIINLVYTAKSHK